MDDRDTSDDGFVDDRPGGWGDIEGEPARFELHAPTIDRGDPYRARKPVAESRFQEAMTRDLRGSDVVILRDGSGHEIGIRALADILHHAAYPLNYSWVEVESFVRNSKRIAFDGTALTFWDEECGVWVELPRSIIEKFIQSYAAVQYGDPNKRTGLRKRVQLEKAKLASARDLAITAVHRHGFFDDTSPGLQFLDKFVYYDGEMIGKRPPAPELKQRDQYSFVAPDERWLGLAVDDEEWSQICPPLWHVLTGSIFGDKNDWRAIQQRFGLALFGQSNLLRGAHLWFVGPPGTGKNTVAMAFSSLFPQQTRTSVWIHQVQEYLTSPLLRSRINICGEVRRIRTLDYFKDATSDALIPVRKAQGENLMCKPRFLQVCCSNSTPKIDVDTGAVEEEVKSIVDRFVIIPFKRFEGAARPAFGQEMEAAARGLIGWALAGMLDWNLTRELEVGSRSERIKQAWIQASDPIAQWAAERLIPAEDRHLPIKTAAWRDYRRWCEESNVPRGKVGTEADFSRGIRALGLPVGKKTNLAISCLIGLKLVGMGETDASS